MSDLEKAVIKQKNGANLFLFITPNADISLFPAGFNNWRNRIEVKVTAKAKDNKANLEVVKIIAKFFNISIKNVSIIHGKKSRDKTVSLIDVSVNEVIKMLKESLNGL
jgi:uncharacterized protein (TIGR00251 family)